MFSIYRFKSAILVVTWRVEDMKILSISISVFLFGFLFTLASAYLSAVPKMLGPVGVVITLFGGLFMGLSLILFANQLIDWSERTFSPKLDHYLRKTEGKYYKPRSTPPKFVHHFTWAIRIGGLIWTISCGLLTKHHQGYIIILSK